MDRAILTSSFGLLVFIPKRKQPLVDNEFLTHNQCLEQNGPLPEER